MAPLTVLPVTLPSGSLALGQLITDPIYADQPSFTPTSRPSNIQTTTESKYKTAIAHDEYNRFLRTASEHTHLPQDNLFSLTAEVSLHSSLAKPRSTFDTIRQDSAARAFFRKTALQRQPLYYVSKIQTLKNPSVAQRGSAEATSTPVRLPAHVRRIDSASSIDTSNTKSKQGTDESIFAVELLKVKCHVGDVSEPLSLDDIDYEWTHYALEGEQQLSIGLGNALSASELRALAGIVADEDFTDESWDSQTDDDEGIGGF